MKKKLLPTTFHALFILYSRNEVYKRRWLTWLTVKAVSMAAVVIRALGSDDLEERAYEGIHAATSLGEDHLMIVSDTKAHVRIVHSIIVEQNQGY